MFNQTKIIQTKTTKSILKQNGPIILNTTTKPNRNKNTTSIYAQQNDICRQTTCDVQPLRKKFNRDVQKM